MPNREQRAHFLRLLVLCLLVFTTACASGKTPDEGIPSDGAPEDASTLAGFGEPCTETAQCASGVCLDAEGDIPGWCSLGCDAGCPSGYACRDEDSVCVHAQDFICLRCTSDAECGGEGNRCVEYEGGSFCASDCANAGDSCPGGFSCQPVTVESTSLGLLCMSDSGVCCVDADGDFRGRGDDCRATDCNDNDADIYDDADEVCDGKDNDCSGGVDVDVSGCGKADCRLSSNGFVMRAAETCVSAECVEQPEVLCGLYTCSEGGDSGDACATSCDAEDDGKCADPAHCDASACESDYGDGQACNETSDCQSAHCENGFCCAFGNCCQQASDCPSFGTFDPVCEDPRTCQGSKGAAVCTAGNTCATTGEEQDDSACGVTTVANECGFFRPVFCTGQVTQTTPTCPTTCASNADCDANAFCNSSTSVCEQDHGDGGTCGQDAQCQSGHCQNGFCCSGGDCCSAASDCPAGYSTAPSCTIASACQGQRNLAQCVSSQCSTLNNAPDDSACTSATIANTCGPYLSLLCTGVIDQSPPVCPTSCSSNAQCDADAYCNAQGQCEFDEVNGSACAGDAQCTSGHCENGFCCGAGDCCADNGDCDHLDQSAACDSQSSCQGTRTDGVCGANFQCSASVVGDDSACAGLLANDCSLYPGVSCTSSANQSSNQAALCATTCVNDTGCDVSAHCDNGSCVPDAGPGGFCNQQSDCSSGLVCVDSVCCNNSCTGTCNACDLAGSVGTCSLVADGQDPDAECGAVNCSGFYFGWQSNTCFAKADVSAAAASCSGSASCATASEECSAQTARGTASLVCDSTCQSPNLSSCTGTTAGSCNNLNLGTQTCGTGACQVTVNRCTNGSPQSCVANSGAARAETCDGIDNNCDGSIDNGLPTDSYELNNSCASHHYLGLLGEGLTQTYNDMTIYTAGDEDWYRQTTTESFTTCTPGVNEEYLYTVTLTPPTGKDYDLEVCYNSFTDSSCSVDCFTSVLGGDQSDTVSLAWDGPCGGGTNDGLNFFIRVHPFAGANSCRPYTLVTQFIKTN